MPGLPCISSNSYRLTRYSCRKTFCTGLSTSRFDRLMRNSNSALCSKISPIRIWFRGKEVLHVLHLCPFRDPFLKQQFVDKKINIIIKQIISYKSYLGWAYRMAEVALRNRKWYLKGPILNTFWKATPHPPTLPTRIVWLIRKNSLYFSYQ